MVAVFKQGLKEIKQKFFADITEIPEVLQPSYLPGLDGLRAVAITIVLFGHAFIGRRWLNHWINYFPGAIGVDIFFVISGFLITTLLLKERIKKGKVSLRMFYIRRSLRIFPVAYLYLICLMTFNLIFNLHTTLRMFLTAGLYVGNFPVRNGNNWQTAHFWSLAVEEQFYLLFPFVLVKWPNKFLLLITIILVLTPFIVTLGGLNLSIFHYKLIHEFAQSLTYLFGYGTSSILIGSLTSILLFKGIIVINAKSSYYLSLILFVLAFCLHANGVLNWDTIIYVFPLLISSVIVLNLRNDNFFSLILNHPIIIKIGIFSYSIYMWQQLFTYDQPWNGLFKYSGSLFLNGIALFFVAYVSYTFFESNFLKLKKHFKVI